MTNQIVKQHGSFLKSEPVRNRIEQVVGKRAEQFTTSLLSIVNNNTLLAKASPESVLGAAMKAAVLNLPIEPSLGYAYVVPYNRSYKEGTQWRKVCEAQFQLGYKGLIQLAQRSGLYKSINAGVVYKSQLVSYNPMFEELELDFNQPEDEIVGYFAAFRLLNGFEKVSYWTKEKAAAHGKRFSKSFDTGPWNTDFDAMAQKTILKDILSKYGPLSIDMQTAIGNDNEDATVSEPKPTKDVTPEETGSLSELLGQPQEEKEVSETNETAISKTENTADTSYPADEIPDFDEETGEVLEEISFFEGNTTTIKE